jgi:hypothetical protein
MAELAEQLFQRIKNNKISDSIPGNELISPQYPGLSILNIPASAAKLLDAPGLSSPPLSSEILEPLTGNTKNVILVLIDALAYHRLQKWLAEEEDLIWHTLIKEGIFVPITSITPSTTCAAITTFWTDSPAVQHGILGYEMWLKEFGVTANMIEHKPITYQGGTGNLSLAGFDPESFLPVGSITDHFEREGVEVHAFQHYAIINSGLSRMFMTDATRHPIGTASDLWISIRELLEAWPNSKKYIWAYWDKLDSISHFFGPDSERAKAELLTFSAAFKRFFLDELSPALKKDTLVILTADHGQITTNKESQVYNLSNHSQFTNMLHLFPTGENRLAFLHIKPDAEEEVKSYINTTWPDDFVLWEPEEAVEKGIFGPGEPCAEIYDRLGDLIAAARGNAYWWWASKENPLIGRHGGLSAQEMLVPLLAVRL